MLTGGSLALYATTTYTYNVLGGLTRVQDQAGEVTTMAYNALGQKLGMVDPDMGTWIYAYDAAGNMMSQTDANGAKTCFYYDRLNRLVKKKCNASGTCSSQTTYDEWYYYDETGNGHGYGVGQRTTMTDTNVTVQWGYDNRGRVVTETRVLPKLGRYTFLFV